MTEYIGKTPKELEEELQRLIKDYNTKSGSYLVVYAAPTGKPIPDIPMCMDDYHVIYDMLRLKDAKNLDFYIETPGGSGEAAEEIAGFIREKFQHIRFVVSGEAKSAGTILVLSGNEIAMTRSGSLGPIDAQMKIGRSVISAYDYLEWMRKKRVTAKKQGRLNPFDATMVAQVSPGELVGVENAFKFAGDLVIEWLPRHKFRDWKKTETRGIPVTEEMKKKAAQNVVKSLSNHKKWRSHGRSIKIDDLEAMGLKVQRIDESPDVSEIVYRIQTVIRLLFTTTTTYKLFATADEKIFKSAAQGSPIQPIPQGAARFATLDVVCEKCGAAHKLYAKLLKDPKLDADFKGQGMVPFPKDNKLRCACGFEIDLIGIRNELETKTGKGIVD